MTYTGDRVVGVSGKITGYKRNRKWMQLLPIFQFFMFVWNFCFNYAFQAKWVKKYTPAYIYTNKEGYGPKVRMVQEKRIMINLIL